MAARKSCTHLTWGEAKAKSGLAASSSTGQKKNKENLRKQDHGAVLAAKIIKKQQGGNESENKKLAKQYRKQEEKVAALAAQRLQEREEKRLAALAEVRPYDRIQEKALEKLHELVQQDSNNQQQKKDQEGSGVGDGDTDWKDQDTQTQIVESKRMQLDEILALEAMIPEEDFGICATCQIDKLRGLLEQYDAADDDEDGDDKDKDTLRSLIVNHPPLSFVIKLNVDDNRQDVKGSDVVPNDSMDLNVIFLLQVTLPPLYLHNTAMDIDNNDAEASAAAAAATVPQWNFHYVMVCDKSAYCSADKPLESLAWLDETNAINAMNQYAHKEVLPYPCVYEVAVTWLLEHIFDFTTLQPHLVATVAK